MTRTRYARLLSSAAVIALASGSVAWAADASFNIQPQSLNTALNAFSEQSAHPVLFKSEMALEKLSPGMRGEAEPEVALAQLLQGTGLSYRRAGDTFVIVDATDPQSGSAAGDGAEGTVEALIVTAQKREEDIQDVPIAISAFTQEDLTRSQIAGGPDLMTQVPNFTFTKTNFSSYSIQIRGIGTQAISATTDAAVAVAFNNTPFIRNRFFEQEFYDLQRVEVLRGPQGTLYGRNATAGVVNIISQKPSFDFEARLSGDVANYNSTRLEGMINLPLVEDKVAVRLAAAWTKRDGYSTNEITGNPIDGRDLRSTRVSLRLAPTDAVDVNLVWEHFTEDDDRIRSGKQLCHQDARETFGELTKKFAGYADILSQGCLPASLYGEDSFQAPDGDSLPYFKPLSHLDLPIRSENGEIVYPYTSLRQSRDLRVIESTIDPEYRAKSDIVELQASVDLNESLTLASETAYNYDTIYSLQDYNRFNTAPGAFDHPENRPNLREGVLLPGEFGGIFCDPQLGCTDRLVAVDVSRARSRQFSQELRLSSDFDGPFNFSLGANFLRYDTEDKYYVFINTLSMFAAVGGYDTSYEPGPYYPGFSDNEECLPQANGDRPGAGGVLPDPRGFSLVSGCIYMDPNPIGSVNDLGHNYFLSKNPYKLISYAVFGESYFQVAENLKVTAGLRWTVDKKEAPRIPSWVLASDSLGYPVLTVEEQEWREPTGRLTIDWKPDISFTDETLLYASAARGYKAGGSNPPPTGVIGWGLSGLDQPELGIKVEQSIVKPKTFDPEFVNAFEFGAKNTLLDGSLTVNLAAFYYDYTGYQVSQIIDRSAVNYNFDSKVWGLEIEADWRPLENLRLGFKGGYENTRIADGERAIDIMDRTAGREDWLVVRPFPTFPSNCVLPLYTFDAGTGQTEVGPTLFGNGFMGPCEMAYTFGYDPVTSRPYVANPTLAGQGQYEGPLNWNDYPGFDPSIDYGNNGGEGFFKDLGGNELPNAPDFTATLTVDYTVPLPSDWLMTLHSDFYMQSEAWTRVFNMEGYDKLKAYTNVNLAAIFTNDDAGWKVMAYVKNVFDRDSITGAFLNSDDSGLTTNVFLTEPRLFGLRVTKEWTGESWFPGLGDGGDGGPFTLEVGGMLQRADAPYDPVRSAGNFTGAIDPARFQNTDLDLGHSIDLELSYLTPAGWRVSGGIRYGKSHGEEKGEGRQVDDTGCLFGPSTGPYVPDYSFACGPDYYFMKYPENWSRTSVKNLEEHMFLDFDVGHDLGIGSVSLGVRYAKLESRTSLDMQGITDWDVPEWAVQKYSSNKDYDTDLIGVREFEGIGPVLSWDGHRRLFSSGAAGNLDIEAGLSGGVLFGDQTASVEGREMMLYRYGLFLNVTPRPMQPDDPPMETARPASRSQSLTVPTAAAELGLSYAIGAFKLRTGYRWERYYDVLDAGYAAEKQYDRTFDGPYLRFSVGFGG